MKYIGNFKNPICWTFIFATYSVSRGKSNTDESKRNLVILAATEWKLLTIYKYKMAATAMFNLGQEEERSGRIGNKCRRCGDVEGIKISRTGNGHATRKE